jgi:hypothetical protein
MSVTLVSPPISLTSEISVLKPPPKTCSTRLLPIAVALIVVFVGPLPLMVRSPSSSGPISA